MGNKGVVIFDTSAINRLTDDKDSDCLIAGLKSGFAVRLTGTSIEEIAATGSEERRRKLLAVCRRLLPGGDCTLPHQLVIKELLKRYAKGSAFDWKAFPIRSPGYEDEIAREEVTNDELAAQQIEHLRKSEAEFAAMFGDVRSHFDRLFQDGTETRPATFREFLRRLQATRGAFWSLGIGFYERATGNLPDEVTIRKCILDCPPFHALVLAICVAEYERCIREPTVGRSLRAGRLDLFMSVFLPYCQQFITADERQERCLSLVASEGKLSVQVRPYDEFRSVFSLP